MLRHRELLKVEDIFRIKVTDPRHLADLSLRDRRGHSGGHVFCSFLALVLRKVLEDRLAAAQF